MGGFLNRGRRRQCNCDVCRARRNAMYNRPQPRVEESCGCKKTDLCNESPIVPEPRMVNSCMNDSYKEDIYMDDPFVKDHCIQNPIMPEPYMNNYRRNVRRMEESQNTCMQEIKPERIIEPCVPTTSNDPCEREPKQDSNVSVPGTTDTK